MFESEKKEFLDSLKDFVKGLSDKISENDEWTVKGFIDIFKNIYTVSGDTKVISKILELQLFPYLKDFAVSSRKYWIQNRIGKISELVS